MEPLAKLWTWAGHTFIPLAVGWAVFVRGGLDGATAAPGAFISRAYWGLLVTFAAAGVLVWAFALYARAAKQTGSGTVIPPNTTFERNEARSPLITWATVVVFAVTVAAALTIFGIRYADSRISKWENLNSLSAGFLGSRVLAHEQGCGHQPCFAVAPRVDAAGKPLSGVNEYVLYLTDGILIAAVLPMLVGLGYLVFTARRRPQLVGPPAHA
jgi:hypothetical protein